MAIALLLVAIAALVLLRGAGSKPGAHEKREEGTERNGAAVASEVRDARAPGAAPATHTPEGAGGLATGREPTAAPPLARPEGVRGQAPDPLPAAEAEPAPPPPKDFPHATEQLLAMALSSMNDAGMAPLPDLSAAEPSLLEDLANAITNAITIYDDEDERTQDVKENVAAMKEQLVQVVEAGGSVSGALKEFEEHVNAGAELRRAVRRKTREIAASNGVEAAFEYLDAANEALKEQDLNPVADEEAVPQGE